MRSLPPIMALVSTIAAFMTSSGPSAAQPPSQGCWNDCPGTPLPGETEFVVVGPTDDVFIGHLTAQVVRYNTVGVCETSWTASTPAYPLTPVMWSGADADAG